MSKINTLHCSEIHKGQTLRMVLFYYFFLIKHNNIFTFISLCFDAPLKHSYRNTKKVLDLSPESGVSFMNR